MFNKFLSWQSWAPSGSSQPEVLKGHSANITSEIRCSSACITSMSQVTNQALHRVWVLSSSPKFTSPSSRTRFNLCLHLAGLKLAFPTPWQTGELPAYSVSTAHDGQAPGVCFPKLSCSCSLSVIQSTHSCAGEFGNLAAGSSFHLSLFKLFLFA